MVVKHHQYPRIQFAHHTDEPVWRPKYQWIAKPIAEEFSCWLLDRGSLTQHIIDCCSDQFQLELVRQQWRRPMLDESMRLQCPQQQFALIREVILKCGKHSWVYARTVIPRKTITGKQSKLANLGNKSLGSVLFSDPSMSRDELEIARLLPKHRLYQAAMSSCKNLHDEIWGRRSVFYVGNHKPLLVSEIFLPDILTCQYR